MHGRRNPNRWPPVGTDVDWQPPHHSERRALCDLALSVGPDRPTLCEGWTVADLVAHLWIREHSPAAAGILVPALAERAEAAMAAALRRHGFEGLVQRVRTGPPWWWRPLDAAANTIEMFVHHEDLRRGDGAGPRPAGTVQLVEAALWSRLGRLAPLLTRHVPVGLELRSPGIGRLRAKAGDAPVTLVGRPGELVLYLYGRRTAADVALEGSATSIAALERAPLGV